MAYGPGQARHSPPPPNERERGCVCPHQSPAQHAAHPGLRWPSPWTLMGQPDRKLFFSFFANFLGPPANSSRRPQKEEFTGHCGLEGGRRVFSTMDPNHYHPPPQTKTTKPQPHKHDKTHGREKAQFGCAALT